MQCPVCGTHKGLTKRQTDVIKLVRQGKPNKVIAYELGMAEGTVKVHMRIIMQKFGLKNRTEVALWKG